MYQKKSTMFYFSAFWPFSAPGPRTSSPPCDFTLTDGRRAPGDDFEAILWWIAEKIVQEHILLMPCLLLSIWLFILRVLLVLVALVIIVVLLFLLLLLSGDGPPPWEAEWKGPTSEGHYLRCEAAPIVARALRGLRSAQQPSVFFIFWSKPLDFQNVQNKCARKGMKIAFLP